MLCLCLYVPFIGEAQTEFQYFESEGLPAELKSIFKLSVFIPSQEFSTFRQWKQVCTRGHARPWKAAGISAVFVERMSAAGRGTCVKCASFLPTCHVAIAGEGVTSQE